MSAIETFRFNGYTLRPAGASIWDYRLANEWSSCDPAHRNTLKGDFWIEQRIRVDSYVFENGAGPLLFFKMHGHGPDYERAETVELFVQFAPRHASSGAEARQRLKQLQEGLKEGFAWVERILSLNGVSKVYFDSRNELLIRFCIKELGFQRDGERLTKPIEPEQTRR